MIAAVSSTAAVALCLSLACAATSHATAIIFSAFGDELLAPRAVAAPPSAPAEAPATRFIAPPAVAAEIRAAVEGARARFQARDAAGVLANVSEHYRSAGLTKAVVRQQLLAMFSLYEEL